MQFPGLQQKASQFVANNASGLLTAGGVIGVGATAFLTGRATFKAAAIIREKQAIATAMAQEEVFQNALEGEYDGDPPLPLTPDFTKWDMAKMVWPQYLPPMVVGVATVSSIVMANRMSAKRAAALAAAYGLSEQRFQEYREKVTEKLGINKERAARDEIAQDKVNENPPTNQVVIIGSGDVLCYDTLSGRYFHSSVEIIKKAEQQINQELYRSQYASLSEFYDEIGLEKTTLSDELGWNTMDLEPLEIRFSTTMTPDNRPCLVLDYSTIPAPDYHRLHH